MSDQLPDDAVTAARKRDTLVADFPADLGRGIPGHDAWIAIAPAGSVERIAARAAADERARLRDEWRDLLMRGRHDIFRPHRLLCGCVSANCGVRLRLRGLLELDSYDRIADPIGETPSGHDNAVGEQCELPRTENTAHA